MTPSTESTRRVAAAPNDPGDGDLPVVVDAEDAYADEVREDERPRRRGSPRWWFTGGLLVSAAVALAVWIGVSNAQDAVSFRDIGFSVDSPSQVTARWQVEKPKDRAVTCLVRALDVRHGVVGAVEVTVPAGRESVVTTTQLRTTTLAVTGTVRSCTLVP